MSPLPSQAQAAPTNDLLNAVQYQRAEVVLVAQVDDDSIESGLTPHHVVWHDGGHKRAQEVEIEIHGSVLPYPLEHTASVFVSLYMGNAPDAYSGVRDARNLRFVGYFDDEEVDDERRVVTFKARDLSALLRDHKPLIPRRLDTGRLIDPTPRYSDTLRQAIERIFSVVPGLDDQTLRDILTIRDTPALNFQLGSLVEGRAKSGPVGLPPRCSAWDAIEIVCGLAARLVSVELNELVVREPREAFPDSGQPDYAFIFGSRNANSLAPRRHKKFIRNRKGVKLIAWNTESRKRMEAVYPSDDEMRKNFPRKRPAPKVAKAKPHKTNKPKKPLPPPERDVQDVGAGVFSQSQLDDMAERIWTERSMHELDGTISSPIWDDDNFKLHNGSRVQVKIRPDLEAQLRGLQSDEERADFLASSLGLERDPARALVRIAMAPHDDLVCVSKVTREWPSKRSITIGYVNLLRV